MESTDASPITANPGGRGRPATATPDEVLRVARGQFLAGERLDVQAIAAQLGLSRATIYRWFGSRDELLAEVLFLEFRGVLRRAEQAATGRGAAKLLAVLDLLNHGLAGSVPFRHFLDQGAASLALITSSGGLVQPRVVRLCEELIHRVIEEDGYDPRLDPPTLAYSLVRLTEAFLYNDTGTPMRGEVERLLAVQATLLGVPRIVTQHRTESTG